ncbi:MAG TPA: NAD(P)H-dependent glycerol-3-phosphate dehydrogenase [Xanthobacteraceae bacterium]|nr:NAD(P)H-dependent glycerol-3-phosphate dehydrogenase [Xanthobacteraceae bacterium]
MSADRIAIVGAGAWGTALANVIARGGRSVTLFARDAAAARTMTAVRESRRLPGVPIDERVAIAALSERPPEADAILVAVPAQALRGTVSALAGTVAAGTPVVACAKGIERTTRRFMTEIIAECLPGSVPAILSGPGFAADVAHGLPTAVTLAAADEALAQLLARTLGSPAFRPYHSTDVRGVEIGGAAKNVLAIAAGIVAGRKLGASALAALTTRGFAELMRFGRAYGAQPETLTGLSGLGDLILTCTSPQSRNFSLGLALGQGRDLPSPASGGGRARGGPLVEGAFTAAALIDMARARNVEMPIAAAVAAVLDGALSIDAAIEALLTRPLRAEGWQP